MTRIWTPRGAADRFDREVDAVVDPSRGPGSPTQRSHPDRDELLALVAAIRDLPEVAPRPAHVADLRARLMAEAEVLAAARATSATPVAPAVDESRLRLRPAAASSRRRRRTTVVVGTLTALGVSASVGVAAQTALPGESLYGVKRALETARTQVALSQPARGALLLDHASDRLEETVAVLDGSDLEGTAALPSTLDSFSAEASEASEVLLAEYARTGDRALVDDLRTFTAASSASLTGMRDQMPELGRAAWQRATEAVAAIDTDALAACPLCSADLDALSFDLPVTPDFDAPRGVDLSEQVDPPEPTEATQREPGDGQSDRRGGRGGLDGDDALGRNPGATPRDPQDPDVPDAPGTPSPGDPDSGGPGLGLERPLNDLGRSLERGLLGGGRGDDDRGAEKGDRGDRGLGGLDDLIP